jgi:hypothetical protein
MPRLRNGQVKFGTPRHKYYTGSQRRVVNHMRIGTNSRFVLLNILNKRLDHLLVCHVCNDLSNND